MTQTADRMLSDWVFVPRTPSDKMMILGGFRFAGRVPNDQVFPEVHKIWDDMLNQAQKEKDNGVRTELVRPAQPIDQLFVSDEEMSFIQNRADQYSERNALEDRMRLLSHIRAMKALPDAPAGDVGSCAMCNGTGWQMHRGGISPDPCIDCSGTGKLQRLSAPPPASPEVVERVARALRNVDGPHAVEWPDANRHIKEAWLPYARAAIQALRAMGGKA